MSARRRPQPHRFAWPLTAQQVQDIDESFQILFDQIKLIDTSGTEFAVTTEDPTPVRGDLLVGDSTPEWDHLPIGGASTVLRTNGIDPSWGKAQLTTDVAGVLPVANGGTGDSTLTNHGVLLGQSTSPVVATSVGATNTVLHGNTGADPTFSAVSLTADVSGILPLAKGGTGADLSATGGTSQVVRQSSAGAVFTVSQLAASNLSNGTTGTGAVVLADSPALTTSPTAPTQASTDSSTKLATTAFVATAVSNAIAGVNPAVAVQAATIVILPNSPTYNNGVGGIGAFITTLTLNSTLVIDGYTPVVNDRVLVKTEASGGGLGGAKNGVYLVTQVAAVGLAWILTRALDYNQPSDMNNTGAIPVTNGTVNLDTSWVQTSTVTTVGTDAVTFTQFSLNPTTIVVGPTSATNLDIAVFDGTSGKLIKDGSQTIASLKNALLDGTNHTDTAAGTVARGDIIVANSTPAWARVAKGAANSVLTSNGTDPSWSTGPTVATITVTGTTTPQALLDISGASAGQIKFPATQNASSDVNTLDDYEEGSWTPGLQFGGAAVGMTFASRSGRYVKIGKMVFIWGAWALSAKGSSTGNAAMNGLPFNSASSGSLSSVYIKRSANLSTITALAGSVPLNGATIDLGDLFSTVANETYFNNNTFVDAFTAIYEAST